MKLLKNIFITTMNIYKFSIHFIEELNTEFPKEGVLIYLGNLEIGFKNQEI